MNTKCQPPKSPYHKHEFSACRDTKSFDALFLENIKDIADTLAQIMVVCGIPRCKANGTQPIIRRAFKFYDIKRHRFDDAIKCGITRDDIVCGFQRILMMTHMEALLAYNIIKRAVKAFYHGTPDFSIRSPITEAVLLKNQATVWQHAAIRTSQLFQRFENIFYDAHTNYANKISQLYRDLHERIIKRADPVIIEDYHPRGCVKKVIVGTKSPPKIYEKPRCVKKCQKIEDLKAYINSLPDKEFPFYCDNRLCNSCEVAYGSEKTFQSPSHTEVVKRKKKPKNVDLNLSRCYQCNCPQLVCDCKIEPDTGILAVDCSQGPFECQWFRIDKDDKPDPCIEKRDLHQCPVDCTLYESSSESDDCQYCECSEETESDESKEPAEQQEFEESDNEESLNRLMPKNLPKRKNTAICEVREISKFPPK